MTFNGILALVTTLANATIIAVIFGNKKFTGGHMKFRVSLAISDLLVGIIVFPSFIITPYFNQIHPLSQLDPIPTEENRNATDMRLTSSLPLPYVDFVGFVTSLSLTVSVYTLMLASFDRYKVISDPLGFAKTTSDRFAKWSIAGSWIFAAVLAALPVWVPTVQPYLTIVGGLLIGVRSDVGVILYVVTLGLPLLMVWVASVSTMCVASKQAKVRREMVSKRVSTPKRSVESRLNKTLWTMVGAFTASILPAVVLSLLSGLANINYNSPETLDKHAAYVFGCLEVVAAILLMCNSLWNCFIYSLRNQDFREEVCKLFARLAHTLGLSKLAQCSCCNSFVQGGQRRFSSTLSIFSTRKSRATLSENVTELSVSGTRRNQKQEK